MIRLFEPKDRVSFTGLSYNGVNSFISNHVYVADFIHHNNDDIVDIIGHLVRYTDNKDADIALIVSFINELNSRFDPIKGGK